MQCFPLEEPELKFSRWIHWSSRSELVDSPEDYEADSDYPALYLFGRFTSAPHVSIPARASSKETVYIGKTSNVRRRPISSHNKPKPYSQKYSDWSLRYLYVALWDIPQWFDVNKSQKVFLAYAEHKLLWEYASQWGCLPPLNSRIG